MEPAALRAQLESWLQTRPGLFHVDAEPDGVRILEVETGKSLRVASDRVQEIEPARNALTGADYLVLRLESVPPLALADAGFVFPVDTRNTGELPGAPATMSFRDYRRLHRHLRHLVETQADAEHRREALDVTLLLIASLDGARSVGLPTQVEEADLETVIRRIEAGA